MKDNTYVIPAIQFYILKGPVVDFSSFTKEEIVGKLNLALKSGNASLIPFENVDGLTVKEMIDCLQIKEYFAVVAAATFTEKRINNHEVQTEKTNINILSAAIFNTSADELKCGISVFDVKNDELDQTVDRLYQSYIERSYCYDEPRTRSIYNSFLEKYQYQDYEQTKKKKREIYLNRK